MRRRRSVILRACRTALLLAALGPTAAAVAQSTLADCAAISSAAERIACYDHLAGHTGTSAAGPPAAAMPPAAAAAPAAGAAPVPNAAPLPAAAPAAAATAPASARAPGAAAPAAALPKDSFGLYAAEHPAPPHAAADLSARVTAVGVSESGRMTVALDGGAVWELAEADRLLAVGDTFDIRRAALGSFLMVTPSKRTHRVRRLR
jgi:hypothetical protein